MLNRTMRATTIALGFLALATAPAAAQERPLGSEVPREQRDSMNAQRREIERHRAEMERHRAEMERHARAMSEALARAYRDSAGHMRMYWRQGALDSARHLYSLRIRTPCARMGIAFEGDDTIVVREVLPGSGAAQAGVQPGDVIVRVDGERANERAMAELAESMEAGDRIRLVVRRGGREQTIDVTAREDVCPYRTMLSEAPFRMMCLRADSADAEGDPECEDFTFHLPQSFEELHREMPFRFYTEQGDSGMLMRFHGPDGFDSIFIDLDSVRMMSDAIVLQLDSLQRLMPLEFRMDSLRMMMPRIELQMRDADESMHAHGLMLRSMELGARALAGARLTDLNEDLADYFDVESGVLVTDVEDGTPAARAGLRGGDVIIQINGEEIAGLDDIHRNAVRRDGPVELTIVRRGERRTIRLAE